MLAYSKTYEAFCQDINQGIIVDEIKKALNRDFSSSEKNSFRNSLGAVKNALSNTTIPDRAQVGLEFRVPLTQKRIDFIIAGEDEQKNNNVVIVELKQWDKVKHTDMSDVVLLGTEEHVHPSWQAFSYGTTISNFNEWVETHPVSIYPCTFLHNYEQQYSREIRHEVYREGIQKAPAFINGEWVNFAAFIGETIEVLISIHPFFMELTRSTKERA